MKFIAQARDICKWEKYGRCTCPASLTIYKDVFNQKNSLFCLDTHFKKENGKGCNFFLKKM